MLFHIGNAKRKHIFYYNKFIRKKNEAIISTQIKFTLLTMNYSLYSDAVAGAVIGSLAGVAVAAFTFYYFFLRKPSVPHKRDVKVAH